jgi:hypothetical protein
MADVGITVDCTISGQQDDFDYETENTLSQFISDLQELGMAWAKGKAPEYAAVIIYQNAFLYDDCKDVNLVSLGVMSGTIIRMVVDFQCGSGYQVPDEPADNLGNKTGLVRRTRKKLTKR